MELANLYERYDQLESAKDHFNEAHRLANICMGDDHPETEKLLKEFYRVQAVLFTRQQPEATKKS